MPTQAPSPPCARPVSVAGAGTALPTPIAAATAHVGAGPIPALDGIRAVAVLLVVLMHATDWRGLIPGGYGVTVFFFLSGYLITTLLEREWQRRGGRIALGAFWVRRGLRILPPAFLLVGLAALLWACAALPGQPTAGATASQLGFWSNWWIAWEGRDLLPGTEHLWSLAVEEQFYLVWPVLYIALRGRLGLRALSGCLLTLVIAVLAWRCALHFALDAGADRIYYGTDTRADVLLLGCWMALACNPVAASRPRWSGHPWLTAAAALATVASLAIVAPAFAGTARFTIQGLALVPLFHYAIAAPDAVTRRALRSAPAAAIGRTSYGAYLLHLVLVELLLQHTDLGPVARTAVLLPALAVATALLWFGLEVPLQRWRRAWR